MSEVRNRSGALLGVADDMAPQYGAPYVRILRRMRPRVMSPDGPMTALAVENHSFFADIETWTWTWPYRHDQGNVHQFQVLVIENDADAKHLPGFRPLRCEDDECLCAWRDRYGP